MKSPKCKNCGGSKDGYLGYWCPKCEVPDFEESMPILNLLKVLTHLEVFNKKIKDKLWLEMCDLGLVRNDSYFTFDIEAPVDNDDVYSKEMNILFKWLISKGLKDGDRILFYVTW